MRKILYIFTLVFTISCTDMNKNPLLEPFDTRHGTAPFDRIKCEHFEPAIAEGIRQQQAEIDAIVAQKEDPTFENTIEALELSGSTLDRITAIFFNLLNSDGDDEMLEISERISPLLTEHGNNINLNEGLFARIKAVYNSRDTLQLTTEQQRLLTTTYEGMVRNGANLGEADKARYRELSNELSLLGVKFDANVLKATNAFEMLLTDDDEVAGLPQSALDAAALRAKDKGYEGYLFDLSFPSYSAFLKYASRRDLREKLYMAYNTRCTGGEYDNREIVKRMAAIRHEKARLLGKKDYASHVLSHRMAQDSKHVYDLLHQLLDAYKPHGRKEVEQVRTFAERYEGKPMEIMPWDFSYYSVKLKDELYKLNDEMLKPYFELEAVKGGVFGLASRLYGLRFERVTDIPLYHPEAETYEVFDANNDFLGVLYTDFHPRATKQGGAWMTEFKRQWQTATGENSRPHVSIVMNFSRATENSPALLTFGEVETFLHEFGHSLHGLLTNCRYESLSGTSVYNDFVELPSQLMENWLPEPEFLHTFARHYETGELIPDTLVAKIQEAANFQAGYLCVRQLTFGLLDMAWHTLSEEVGDIFTFEHEAIAPTQLLPVIDTALISTQFSHIFGGGYAAGYYSYKWSEVLDADAFSLFKEKGIFDTTTAISFRRNVLEKGNTEDPMTLYVRFRGREPQIDALMHRDGIK
ncbi:MAG: M3 family metallopeptidase [Coprobacter sp.]|nr:M3 family metallopeptidase [Coprobacter sp.]